MHGYAFDAELVRLAILLGVVASMLFYERYGVTTGGAIIPGYLALFVTRPSQIAVTLLLAALVYWIVQRVLRPRLMLWGRRLFEAEVLVAVILQGIWLFVLFWIAPSVPQLTLLYGIGFLLPGIIAHDMGRQGVRTTVGAALLCALVVFGLITLVGATRDLLGPRLAVASTLLSTRPETYAYQGNWLLIGVFVSVLMSMALYRSGLFLRALLPGSLRTGGFVTAGYLALFANRPADLLFVFVCSSITYVIVTRYLMTRAILFGRTKMAAMFLVAMAVTWLAEIIVTRSALDYTPWIGFNAIVPTIVALLANDAQRQGPRRTFLGVGIGTVGVLAAVALVSVVYTTLMS